MISKFVAMALLSLTVHSAFAKELVIISDLDETLRVANVENHIKAGLKLIEGVKPYEGLSAIFREIKQKNPDAKFYYLSNSYKFLYNGRKWIKENNLPEGEVFQRVLKDKSDTFKPINLKKIVEENAEASFLFFGDNIERDPKFYRDVIAETNLADAKVFIRDARLLMQEESDATYFQTDAQITDDLGMSEATTELVNNLSFSKLVPSFLLKNLNKRLVKECKTAAVSCEEEAAHRVQEVIKLIAPQASEELLADE